MKNKILAISLFLVPALYSGLAHAELADAKKELLLDIKEEATKCITQIVSANNAVEEVAGYQSSCSTIKILSSTTAQVFIDNEWFSLEVKESELSDGGDLDDLFVYNSKQQLVATRENVAAYDSVIMAMAPGVHFKQQKN
ncbi:MAG TPA: hypothetical protein VF412_09410 [Bdellovibrio sp.]|uniref:hypothetical protein n=1 Tax=Bdellovibrio sp. TaxID=28201 RepID=UPI002F15C6D1